MLRGFRFPVTFLVVVCVTVGVHGANFRIVLIDSGKDSVTTDTYVLVAGGYTDGLENDMQGMVFAVGKDGDTTVTGTGIIDDVSRYQSSCLVRVSGEEPVKAGHFIALEPPERDHAVLFEKGRHAFDKADYERAEFFLSAALDGSSSQDSLAHATLVAEARDKAKKELKRKLNKEEKSQEEKRSSTYLTMAHFYFVEGRFTASEYYLRKLQRIFPKDKHVKEVLKTIDGLRDFDAEEAGREILAAAGYSPDDKTVEVYPKMIAYDAPEYPNLARRIGLEGVVWVKALVLKTGMVAKATVHKTSGNLHLDNAAVVAAYQNKFQPGVQKGKAINCWVCWKVTFVLDD